MLRPAVAFFKNQLQQPGAVAQINKNNAALIPLFLRYDKMVGRFTGKDVPACGFSIGFERIILIMMETYPFYPT